MTVNTPEMVASKGALQSSTIQEYLAQCTHREDKVMAFQRVGADLSYYTPHQIEQLAHDAATFYQHRGIPRREDGGEPKVIGLQASSTIEWVVTFVALLQMGHTIFALAPTLSEEVTAKLLEKATCRYLISESFGPDTSQLPAQTITLASVEEVSAEKASTKTTGNADRSSYWATTAASEVVFIVHSSGTTGLPKLIPKTHRELMMALNSLPPSAGLSVFVGSSFYYMVGIFTVLMSFMKTRPAFYANEKLPLSSESYRQLLEEARPNIAYFVPFLLSTVVSDEKSIDILAQCMMVAVIGGVFPKQLGDKLTKRGVRLANEYGMSEVACGMNSATRPPGDADWEYVEPSKFNKPHMAFLPLDGDDSAGASGSDGEQLYELVILPSHPLQDKQWANREDGSIHTGDLFLKHPTLERWKPVGRRDDVVKTYPGDDLVCINALPYEEAIKSANGNLVDEAVVFGEDRPRPGVLVFVKAGCAVSDSDILGRVWNGIERDINGTFKVGLDKEMVKLVRGATVPRTAKGSVIRAQVYLRFEDAIESVYSEEG
ncbi:uncharacterized protein CDV56_108877 [Aspergillus thermomutatus]|uniref:AMP-dependent synthetase/ligase domain-containing protein n=1 Tax=Aspergillus thermomutatus TaxID=41047 RepID=A0A397HP54_ASPTH|nr:uncharacterized protein CDV56_108877 [Aspergillus thermomutatus]RHZ64949.1 hypothetical protein CDV56_108877 [Aspergillus thermomutatus]